MFIGHALLAFALATLIADRLGWPARRALTLGLVTGAFAAIPDVDMAYAAVAIDIANLTVDELTRPSTLWGATRDVHRAMTHSLAVSVVAGTAFGLWAVRGSGAGPSREAGSGSSRGAGSGSSREPGSGSSRSANPRSGRIATVSHGVAAVVFVALVVGSYAASGTLGGIVMGSFVAVGVGIATLCRARTAFSGRTVGIAAVAGLLSHPWGDLVTGEPPKLFYPFDVRFLDGRVLLHGDPTVHLLGAFTLELAVVWLAAIAVAVVTGRSWRRSIDRRAALGGVYGVAAVAMAPPTLEVSYHFVFSILSVGLVCGGLSARARSASPVAALRDRLDPPVSLLGVVFTVLGGVTVALAGYVAVYALVAFR